MNWRGFAENGFELFLYFSLLALMWVGAEYVFEGAVHSSSVDAVVCLLLAKLVKER